MPVFNRNFLKNIKFWQNGVHFTKKKLFLKIDYFISTSPHFV